MTPRRRKVPERHWWKARHVCPTRGPEHVTKSWLHEECWCEPDVEWVMGRNHVETPIIKHREAS